MMYLKNTKVKWEAPKTAIFTPHNERVIITGTVEDVDGNVAYTWIDENGFTVGNFFMDNEKYFTDIKEMTDEEHLALEEKHLARLTEIYKEQSESEAGRKCNEVLIEELARVLVIVEKLKKAIADKAVAEAKAELLSLSNKEAFNRLSEATKEQVKSTLKAYDKAHFSICIDGTDEYVAIIGIKASYTDKERQSVTFTIGADEVYTLAERIANYEEEFGCKAPQSWYREQFNNAKTKEDEDAIVSEMIENDRDKSYDAETLSEPVETYYGFEANLSNGKVVKLLVTNKDDRDAIRLDLTEHMNVITYKDAHDLYRAERITDIKVVDASQIEGDRCNFASADLFHKEVEMSTTGLSWGVALHEIDRDTFRLYWGYLDYLQCDKPYFEIKKDAILKNWNVYNGDGEFFNGYRGDLNIAKTALKIITRAKEIY